MGRSPEVEIEYVHHRRGVRWRLAAVLAGFALMLGILALFGVAYAMQSDQVDELKAQNETILEDHHVIGAKFAEQSKRLQQESRKVEEAIRSSYGQGFLAGQEAARLPRALRPLARQAAAGVLVPHRVPPGANGTPNIERDLEGYTIRWPRLAVFASKIEPLSDWTRQALSGSRRARIGRHRVQRLVGPTGVIYAWRTRGTTYAVISLPAQEPRARALVRSMQ